MKFLRDRINIYLFTIFALFCSVSLIMSSSNHLKRETKNINSKTVSETKSSTDDLSPKLTINELDTKKLYEFEALGIGAFYLVRVDWYSKLKVRKKLIIAFHFLIKIKQNSL